MEYVIKLWDNEEYEYPLIIIESENIEDFKKILKEYQESEEYNIDEFICLVEKQSWFIKIVSYDEEVFF